MENNKLIIKVKLLRKEPEFETDSYIVEKAIAVTHAEFEKLKSHPLRDMDMSEPKSIRWTQKGEKN